MEVRERVGADIQTGLVTCSACATWYRLENGLLELLVPALRSKETDASFCRRTGFDGNPGRTAVPDEATDPALGHKIGQKQFYDEDAASYETSMMRLPFWRAFDDAYLQSIRPMGGPDKVMVEVGGGSGRLSLPLRNDFRAIASFDISEAMVRRAMRRLAEAGGASNVHYFVADAENVPIRPGVADVVVFSGILHHVAAPDQVIQEAVRVLRRGGQFIGMENNESVFRPLFDALMNWHRLWNEKAHPEHFVISERDLRLWFTQAGVTGQVWTSVFLPPHLFNLLSVGAAHTVLRATDAVARKVPFLRGEGGLVLFRGQVVADSTTGTAPPGTSTNPG